MDPSVGYREMLPPQGLRDLVDCVWIRVTEHDHDLRVVPDGRTDVVWRRGAGVTIAGPDTRAKILARASGDLLVGIRFLPGAGAAALGVPLDGLTDLRVDAAEIERAFDLDPDLDPGEVVSRFISVVAGRRPDPLVAEAARRLGGQDIAGIAKELQVSERQLLRRFKASVGYGPKTLDRVMRFRRFVELLGEGRTDLARLALDAGYSDQAHLTRETTRLAGVPPLEFIRSRRQ
jgi:AraC-like DNA-binding protein